MKRLTLIFSLIPFTSCSMIEVGNLAPGYTEAFDSVYSFFKNDKTNNQITKELIKNIPYASAIMSIGRGQDALMILESKNSSSEYTWVSQDGVYLVFKAGKITKTSGLDNNLIETVSPEINYEDLLEKKSISFLQYLSYDKPQLNNLKVETTLTLLGQEKVNLFDGTKTMYLVKETIKNEYLGWEVLNNYWLDENFIIQKGTQHISPKLPKFFFEITKKPAI